MTGIEREFGITSTPTLSTSHNVTTHRPLVMWIMPVQMTQANIADSYTDAQRIITKAKYETFHIDVIFSKMCRVSRYLDNAAAEELATTLAE